MNVTLKDRIEAPEGTLATSVEETPIGLFSGMPIFMLPDDTVTDDCFCVLSKFHSFINF